VHSAEDWAELLLPEIERQQRLGKEVVFRADAAFAKPEIYEALEERGVKYAIRIPANDSLERDIAELLTRPVGRPSHKPVVWYKGSSTSRELEDGTACGGESGVPRRGVIPPSRICRDQLGDAERSSGAVL
jgi:Transposase DDE domain group 1